MLTFVHLLQSSRSNYFDSFIHLENAVRETVLQLHLTSAVFSAVRKITQMQKRFMYLIFYQTVNYTGLVPYLEQILRLLNTQRYVSHTFIKIT